MTTLTLRHEYRNENGVDVVVSKSTQPMPQPSPIARMTDLHPVIGHNGSMSVANMVRAMADGIPANYSEAGMMILAVYHERTGQHAGGTCDICDMARVNALAEEWLAEHALEAVR